jgi:hypothetical protein
MLPSQPVTSQKKGPGPVKHDLGISVAVQTIAAPHDRPDLHVLPAVKWIWDPAFRYTPSYATDLRKTFERIRRHGLA